MFSLDPTLFSGEMAEILNIWCCSVFIYAVFVTRTSLYLTKRPKEDNYFCGLTYCAECWEKLQTNAAYNKTKDGNIVYRGGYALSGEIAIILLLLLYTQMTTDNLYHLRWFFSHQHHPYSTGHIHSTIYWLLYSNQPLK